MNNKYEQEFRIIAIQVSNLVEVLKYTQRQFGIDDFERFIDTVKAKVVADLDKLIKR